MKPYIPSSGTEGMEFEAMFCDRCEMDRAWNESGGDEDGCEIHNGAIWGDEAPEWVIDEHGPRCTAFQKIMTGDEPLPGQGELFKEAM